MKTLVFLKKYYKSYKYYPFVVFCILATFFLLRCIFFAIIASNAGMNSMEEKLSSPKAIISFVVFFFSVIAMFLAYPKVNNKK